MGMPQLKTVPERFEERYIPEPNSGCWLWIGEIEKAGYGSFFIRKERVSNRVYRRHKIKAHRLSWQLAFGEIPEGIEVCHKCDIPSCVNPEHLFLGTHKENMDDRERKGRTWRGSQMPQSRVTEKEVLEIRASREPLLVLAARYDIDFRTVSQIRRGTTWKHVA